ncbi:MAG: DUF3656 domain-containing protein [Clostridia bacterium]|nr:DUF3656 domain-containing protein [Clostridia bacterium]
MRNIELLAPAGSEEAIISAVQSGADAIYLGLDKFSARDGAKNLGLSELEGWVDYCHLRGVKVFLAANTLVKDNEAEEFIEYIGEATRCGIDAVIVQDMGMAELIKTHIPDLPIHASTQMTVRDKEGVKYLENKGFKRVVLARELTKSELIDIRNSTEIELEMFVHGALCFSYSGQCLMSSIIGRRSGNRGMCAQPCRLSYDIIKDGKTRKSGYLLSPKDLCLIDKIGEIAKIGIDSLKIEGRLKSGEYVASAVSKYKKALSGHRIDSDDINSLLKVFNRSGFTEGWYSGAKHFMSGDKPGNVAGHESFPELLRYTKDNANFKKIAVDIYAELKEKDTLKLTLIDEDFNTATIEGSIKSEKAKVKALSKDRLLSQLSKLGDSVFSVRNSEISIDNDIVLAVSEINDVRRKAVALLENTRIFKTDRKVLAYKREKTENNITKPYITAVCHTLSQAEAASEAGVRRIVASEDILNKLKTESEKVSLGRSESFAQMAMNISEIESDRTVFGGFRLNITNGESIKAYNLPMVTLSPELNLKDIKAMEKTSDTEVIAYGKIPLMLLRACPLKMSGVCRGEGGYSLKDRQGEIFPIECGKNCVSEIFNSKPIYMADKLSEIEQSGVSGLQLWFLDEDYDETLDIIKKYKGEGDLTPPEEFTRGHFYRGFIQKSIKG